MPLQNMSNTVMAYARFEHRPPTLLPALAAEVRRKLPLFSPQAWLQALSAMWLSPFLRYCPSATYIRLTTTDSSCLILPLLMRLKRHPTTDNIWGQSIVTSWQHVVFRVHHFRGGLC